jgi:hypothetical protein
MAPIWQAAGATGPLAIDWDGQGSAARFDPYVAWVDQMTPSLAQPGLHVLVELRHPYADPARHYLHGLGLAITRHYRHVKLPNGKQARPRFVTATCTQPGSLALLHHAVVGGKDPWIERYEISSGFANPDAQVVQPKDVPPPVPAAVPGPLVGFVDHGCPFFNSQLHDANAASRVWALWDPHEVDQHTIPTPALRWDPNTRFGSGRVTNAAALADHAAAHTWDGVLDERRAYVCSGYPPIEDRFATHASHVMDIATGFPDPTRHIGGSGQRHTYPIVFAQLPRYVQGVQVSGLLRAQVLDAVHYVAMHLAAHQRGVINLSYGSNAGPHDGSSLLERALDELLDAHRDDSNAQRLHLVVPSGNAADASLHACVDLKPGSTQHLPFQVAPDDPSPSFIEVWAPQAQGIRVRVVAPDGATSAWVQAGEAQRMERDSSNLALIVGCGQPCQSARGALWLLALAPTASTAANVVAPCGSWALEVINVGSSAVELHAWCERDEAVFGNEAGPRQTLFAGKHVQATGTLNSIAHGGLTTVVGGYLVHDTPDEMNEGPVASMSGTGPGRGLKARDRNAAYVSLPGPQVMAPCSLWLGDEGLPAAAVLSEDTVRLTGTSVSAAYWTRRFIESGFRPPAHRQPPQYTGPIPGRDEHPDDTWQHPRVP